MTGAGTSVYIEYGKQSNFTTALSVGAATRNLGYDTKLTSFNNKENLFTLRDLNTVLVQKHAWGALDGTFATECALENGWFWDAVLGAGVQGGTAGDRTYTYDDAKTVNAFTFEIGFDTDTDRVLQLQRVTCESLSVRANLDDIVKWSANWRYGATPTTAGTSLDASIASGSESVAYTFAAGAILEYPSATPLVEVQSFELNIDSGIKHVREPNSVNSVNAFRGDLGITGKFSLAVKDNTWWNLIRARAELGSTMRLNFTNGLSAGNEKSVQITLTGLGIDELSMPADRNELVTEEISFTARDIQVVLNTPTNAIP